MSRRKTGKKPDNLSPAEKKRLKHRMGLRPACVLLKHSVQAQLQK